MCMSAKQFDFIIISSLDEQYNGGGGEASKFIVLIKILLTKSLSRQKNNYGRVMQ